MKRIVVLMGLSVVACGQREFIQQRELAIADPPPKVPGCTSGLSVPKTCPIYAPGGGDIDTPEAPFTPGVAIMCGVDDAGGTYGIATGDKSPVRMPVLPGNKEIGVYFGFETDAGFSPDKVVLTGESANIVAWAAPLNVEAQTGDDCCPEAHPEARHPLTLVALGEHGILFSLGRFDTTRLQVFYSMNNDALLSIRLPGYGAAIGWTGWRFYVNGVP